MADNPYKKLLDERRIKLVRLTPEFLIGWFETNSNLGDTRPLSVIRGLPRGCIVFRVAYDHYTDAIGFMVIHESFEPIPEGTVPPVFDDITIARSPEFTASDVQTSQTDENIVKEDT